jgi:hypothetical protein
MKPTAETGSLESPTLWYKDEIEISDIGEINFRGENMKQKRYTSLLILITGLLGIAILSACGGSEPSQEAADQQEAPVITVYKSPT